MSRKHIVASRHSTVFGITVCRRQNRVCDINTVSNHYCERNAKNLEKDEGNCDRETRKDPRLAESYRPISLLSTCYKLLEHLVLHRVLPEVEKLPSPEQAGFWRNRSTCKQVAALNTHIENGFQWQLKKGTVFLDLTAAYDTVWHTGLLYNFSKNMPHWFIRLTELFLHDIRFRVHAERRENSGEWASSGVGAIANTLQPLHQRPSCNWVSEVYLCRWHLLDKASTEVCRAGMLSLIRHGAYGLILPPLAA